MGDQPSTESRDPLDAKHSGAARFIAFVIFSLGRLMALVVLTILMAFVVVLAGYLVLPSEVFSSVFSTHPDMPFIKPNLRETLAAACATFFVITLFLWVFDAIDIFPFRNAWMSKAVWGTGVASILSTSVLVYSQIIGPQQRELDGIWQARAQYRSVENSQSYSRKDHTVIMTYDADAGAYVGQSDVNFYNWFSLKLNLRDRAALLTMGQRVDSKGENNTTNSYFTVMNESGRVTLQDNKTKILIGNDGAFPIVVMQRHGRFD